MTMYRQLLLAIILSSILALVGSLLASTFSTRAYLVEQLRVKNQDNASALAVSLSQTADDPIKAELAISAQFDSGNYKLVRFTDAFGKVAVEKKAEDVVKGVPKWFITLLPINVPAGNAKISKGWSQIGEVTLESQSAYAYKSLWSSTVRMTGAMSLAAIIGCYLGALILRRIKRPLDEVVEQANAISEKRFVTIPEPRVPELKKLAIAMNLTVKKLKEIFEEEAKRLEAMRREANYDGLTGLPNRNSFITQLREALHTEETAFGACLILRLSDLAGINKRHGRAGADEAIKRVAKHVLAYSERMQDSLAGRLNGSDFALLVPSDDPLGVAQALIQDVVNDIKEFSEAGVCAAIGMAPYSKGVVLGSLMSQIDVALASAEAEGSNAVRMADNDDQTGSPTSIEGWSLLFNNALKGRLMYLLSFPVGDFAGKILHREGPLRIRESASSPWIPAGKFLPVAERLGLHHLLDLAAVELGLQKLAEDKELPGYAINLSPSALKVSTFVPGLKKLLAANPKEAKRLWLELPEYGVFKNFEEFRDLCAGLKNTGIKLGIEHFGRQFDHIAQLHDLGVNYVKVDASFVRDLDSNPGNQAFLSGLATIAHGIGMLVIAEGVLTEAEVIALQAAGFDGGTGPAIKE
jgi:diguanylate cyclase (GGDEF)-like protein